MIPTEKILDALMTSGSRKMAAQKLGVSPSTLYRRMQTEEFKTMYAAAKDGACNQAAHVLSECMTSAAGYMGQVLMDEQMPTSQRIQCAVNILSFGLRYREATDLIARLEQIENDRKRENK